MLRGSDSHSKEHPVMSDPITLTHPQAVNRLKDIDDELARLEAKDKLTPEDEVSFSEQTREFEEVDEYRKGLERKADRARTKAVRDALGNPNGNVRLERPAGHTSDGYDRDAILEPDSIEDHRFRDPWKLDEMRMFGRSPEAVRQELRARAQSAIEKMPGTKDSVRQASAQILDEFDDTRGTLARQCLLTSSPAYMRGWSRLARGNQQLEPDEQQAMDAVRAMSLTTTAGGFLIPFQLDPTVIITADGSRNDIRQVARTVVATGNKWNGVASTAATWSWDAEASEVSDDATTFSQPAIDIFTARGFVPISIEAFEDEANVTTEVARVLAFGKDVLESSAFATGTGSAQPFGIVTALAGTASEINANTDDVFARADVDKIQGFLPARFRANASWLANNSIYNLIRAFDTSGGSAFWANYGMDRPSELLGRPIYESEAMDSTVTVTGAVSNFILIFGDFSNYVIADRIGMSVEFIPHLLHVTTNRPSGQRGWFAYYRTGADSVLDGAFRLLDVPSTA
jgi:HK97 family phage major capsid protein